VSREKRWRGRLEETARTTPLDNVIDVHIAGCAGKSISISRSS
jgi:hypothetical protein